MSMSSHSQAISAVRWGGEGLLYSASRDTVINVWDAQVLSRCGLCPCSCELSCRSQLRSTWLIIDQELHRLVDPWLQGPQTCRWTPGS